MKIGEVMERHGRWEGRRQYVQERRAHSDSTSMIYNSLEHFIKALRNVGNNRDDRLYDICYRFARQLAEQEQVAVNFNESLRM